MLADMVRAACVLAIAAVVPLGLEVFAGLSRASEHGPQVVATYVVMGIALVTVSAVLAALFAPLVAGIVRLWARAALSPERYATWPGLFGAPRAVVPGAALVHALAIGGVFFLGGTAAVAGEFARRFREPALTGLVTALAALAVAGCAATAAAGSLTLLRRSLRLLPERLAARDPLHDARAATVLWLALAWLGIAALLASWPNFALVFPVRVAAVLTVGTLIVLDGAAVAARVLDPRARPRRATVVSLAVVLPISVLALAFADDGRARSALLGSPPLASAYAILGGLSDVDRDGYSALLGAGDCDAFDGEINPEARDRPDDGIDQNCSGQDYRPGPPRSTAPDAPVPAALRRDDYNLLLVSIDTLRYDRTTPSGYARDTSPRIAELAARAVWFEQAHAAGNLTRESLPVLAAGRHMAELPLGEQLESSYFAPRVLLRDATTLAEVLKAHGYRTAMFTGHHFFADWQLGQGMDHLVNVPAGTVHGASPRIVQAALAHLGGLPPEARWFAWVHLLDPHQPYQSHPGFPSFGSKTADLYDADVAYADHHLGQLVDWVTADAARAARTVIVVTADHGEYLGEGGRSHHGNTLGAILTRVPLLVLVPGMTPRRLHTPVSLVDLAPTITAVLGLSGSPDWTGEARLAALFEGREEPDRVVFAADAARDRYVAIASTHRLHYSARDNLYRLVDHRTDPEERRDVSGELPELRARLEVELTAWRERVAASSPAPR